MSTSYWKLMLQWPQLSARFGLTAIGTGLALLSLLFQTEIWYQHPAAAWWSWLALGIGAAAGCWQVLQLLWQWPLAAHYAGPRVFWPVIRFMRIMVFIVIALFFGLLLLLLLVLLLISK